MFNSTRSRVWLLFWKAPILSLLLVLALGPFGCHGHHGETTASETVSPPITLTLSASQPSGTLDSLPELTWVLSGGAGLSLVVRAQGPGNAGRGEGFAGVRPATGTVSYLSSNGHWGDTEVAYAAASGTSGTFRPTVPQRLEGAWRFVLMAKDVSGELKALAETQVVLSATPQVQVTLSRRGALAGDSVTGSVTLTRGATARPVRLIAYWRAPDGTAERLPDAGTLAYDGPSADISLPLLGTRLDNAAPGPWSLVARLYDTATGAPIAYGEQTLQVYPDVTVLSGGVFGSDGAPLGTGASFAQVQAVALDRDDSVSTPIDATGAFSVALRPGAWMVSAIVVDAGGMHLASEKFLPVGGAMAPIALHAAAPMAVDTTVLPAQAKAAGVPASSVPAQAAPSDCKITDRAYHMRLVTAVDPAATVLIGGPGKVSQLATQIKTDVAMYTQAKGLLLLQTPDELTGIANAYAMDQLLGENLSPTVTPGAKGVALLNSLGRALGGGQFISLAIAKRESPPAAPTLQINLSVVDAISNTTPLYLQKLSVPANWTAALAAVRALTLQIQPNSLATYVRDHANRPTEPRVNILATFGSTEPATLHALTVHLEDCDHSVYAGRTVQLMRSPVPFPRPVGLPRDVEPVRADTDANGDAHFYVDLGMTDGKETLVAYFRPLTGGAPIYSQPFTYAVQVGQTGQVQCGPAVPVLRPQGSATLPITSKDPATGTPQKGQPIVVKTNLGGLQQESNAVTDTLGAVLVSVQAGNTIGLGQVDAYLSATSTPPPTAPHAKEFIVVSSPVALNVTGATGEVLPGTSVPVSGSLLLDGLPMAGTAITLTKAGSGTLSASNFSVSDAGNFEATFQPPPDGTGSATVTATTEVEGQTVTKDVTITWGDGSSSNGARLVRRLDYNQMRYQVYKVEPTATTLVFDVAIPAEVGGGYRQTYFLRQENMAVIGSGDSYPGTGIGWGTLSASGIWVPMHLGVPNAAEYPSVYGVSRNGLFRAHVASENSSPVRLRIYDSHFVLLEEPAAVGGNDIRAIGPAGQVLYRNPASLDWYVHTLKGGETRIGSFSGVLGKFGPAGDKIYIADVVEITEVDIASGVTRRFTAPDGLLGNRVWTVESGGILYGDYTAGLSSGVLRRIDLITGQSAAVGTMPVLEAYNQIEVVP